jgi:hypothetical protein
MPGLRYDEETVSGTRSAMPKEAKLKQHHLRTRIAVAAARIMAEDGVDDFALAKRKAARQVGAQDNQALPDNEEIEFELRTYQSLFQGAEQRERLRQLRRQALAAMRLLEPFRPYLSGPVLNGTAGRYSDIDLQVFTDDSKAVELLLLNRGIPYQVAQQRQFAGGRERAITVLKMDWKGVPLSVAVYCANDERGEVKSTAEGRPLERMGIRAVAQLVSVDA